MTIRYFKDDLLCKLSLMECTVDKEKIEFFCIQIVGDRCADIRGGG